MGTANGDRESMLALGIDVLFICVSGEATPPEGGAPGRDTLSTFDQARVEAFDNAGIKPTNDVGGGQMDTAIDFGKAIHDPKTGTYVEFTGENGGKVAYDSAHPPSKAHPNGDPQHVHYVAPKKSGGKGKIHHSDASHPGRPSPQQTKAQRAAKWNDGETQTTAERKQRQD